MKQTFAALKRRFFPVNEHAITPHDLNFVRDLLAEHRGPTRSQLAVILTEKLGWSHGRTERTISKLEKRKEIDGRWDPHFLATRLYLSKRGDNEYWKQKEIKMKASIPR